MRCPKCGNELPDESKFCPYCMDNFMQEGTEGNIIDNEKNGKSKNKMIIAICAIVLGVILLVAVGIGIAIAVGGNDSKSKESKSENSVSYYDFVDDTNALETGKCFDVTFAQFIDCYNKHQKKEYGDYGDVLKKAEFNVQSSNDKITVYDYTTITGITAFALIVDNDTDKIISIEYMVAGKGFATNQAEEYCYTILSFATNGKLSWQQISEKMAFNDEDEVVVDDKYGNTVFDKGIMFCKMLQSDESNNLRTVYGLVPMTEKYYKKEVRGNDKAESDEDGTSDGNNISGEYVFIEDTDSGETGKRFNVTFDKFLDNYNEYFCERGMSEEYYGTTPNGMKGVSYNMYDLDKNIGIYEFNTNGTDVIEKIVVYVENDSEKILAVECTFNTTVLIGNHEWTYNLSDDILSLATDRNISQEDMGKAFEMEEHYEVSKDDCLIWFRHKDEVMYYDYTTYDVYGNSEYTTFGIAPMSKDYYDYVICENSDPGVGE